MKKRGQVFLVAAIVIASIVAGFATINNVAKYTKDDNTVYDLSKEINFESTQVIDSGVYNSQPDDNTFSLVERLTDYYAVSTTKSDFIFLIGDETTLILISYKNTETGYVGISFGGSYTEFLTEQDFKYKPPSFPRTDDVRVILEEGAEYNFHLRPGQVFFLVLKKETQGERFISLPKQQ